MDPFVRDKVLFQIDAKAEDRHDEGKRYAFASTFEDGVDLLKNDEIVVKHVSESERVPLHVEFTVNPSVGRANVVQTESPLPRKWKGKSKDRDGPYSTFMMVFSTFAIVGAIGGIYMYSKFKKSYKAC